MIKGTISFYKLDYFGFYKRNDPIPTRSDMVELTTKFNDWISECTYLEDTCPFNARKNTTAKQTYCLNSTLDNDTGDLVVVLWRSLTGEGSSVQGVNLKSLPNQEEITTSNKGSKDVVFGEPMYYWFIPEYNMVAAIKLANSVTDNSLMERYFRAYVDHYMETEGRHVKEKTLNAYTYKEVVFKEQDNTLLSFRFATSKLKQQMDENRLKSIQERIVQLVKRDHIAASEKTDESVWSKFADNLPMISPPKTRDFRRVETIMDAEPSLEELKKLVEIYQNEFVNTDRAWDNIGFKVNDSDSIIWLDEFTVREYIEFNFTREKLPILTAEMLMLKIIRKRTMILSGLNKTSKAS